MISASNPSSTGAKPEKPSFAKIAAAGLKQPSILQKSSNNATNAQKQPFSSPPPVGPISPPSHGNAQSNPSHPKKIVEHIEKEAKVFPTLDTASRPKVHVQTVESPPPRSGDPTPHGFLVPNVPDDVGTQVSSSSESNKPQSLDGKSVASGTTFALDEKESLRPDDSASVKAVDDEDVFSPPSAGVPGPRSGLEEDGVRAFRDQLREIRLMDPSPSERSVPQQMYSSATRGVLYVPPQEPGIGVLPKPIRAPNASSSSIDGPPDPKLLEALDNPSHRVWVLKLEQDVIDFVNNATESALTLPQCQAFYRLLAHKMADYYRLDHLVDHTSNAVRLYKTPYCRVPPPLTGITTPSTAASTPPPSAPQMKILRRGIDKAGVASGSSLTSENGDESNEDDKRSKLPLTREEREAKYEAARLRIMGSARPSDSPETQKESQESRSSSATGKKSRKKARADSNDDFEARSAFSNYHTNSYGSDGLMTPSYNYAALSPNVSGQYTAGTYDHQAPTGNMQQMPLQASQNTHWQGQPYNAVDTSQGWAQNQHGIYDMSTDLQRTMTFQNQLPTQNTAINYNSQYSQQYFGAQPNWPQQHYETSSQSHNPAYGYPAFSPSQSHYQDAQPYAYGQLPSQSYPGRPPSNLEHPIPGSYKSKHFNPHSQSFVPGQAGSAGSRPFTPLGTSTASNSSTPAFNGLPPQPQRQTSSHSHVSGGTSHQNSPAPQQSRVLPASGSMMHPLPQPVFPQQHSPSVPLPPKPVAPARDGPDSKVASASTSASAGIPLAIATHQSVTAKWGTPAFLPAKPPPPMFEPFDASKLIQPQRPSFVSAAAAARQSSGNVPTFGSLSASHVTNGATAQPVKRP